MLILNDIAMFGKALLLLLCVVVVLAHNAMPYRCSMPPDPGHGALHTRSWFFDILKLYCKMFIYYGEGGNMNRFHSEKNCLMKCLPGRTRKPVCSKSPYIQRCRKSGPRWYFNATRDTCQQTSLGYCATSANKFYTCLECIHRCSYDDPRHKCRQIIKGLPGPGNPE
ncbi:BPTI/Kunitz domain-containing protein-like [Rhipicephalus sanguineus]|uniref:BPTI/Kunitz domain-containing protein-like n=1 Tax=Rhipicephalus sanguineus TaxID=34632 RepID=UPI001895332F|nr:BPTI/Kunitz domain-containing protein-like [Rhipicephalus sanguineus]